MQGLKLQSRSLKKLISWTNESFNANEKWHILSIPKKFQGQTMIINIWTIYYFAFAALNICVLLSSLVTLFIQKVSRSFAKNETSDLWLISRPSTQCSQKVLCSYSVHPISK